MALDEFHRRHRSTSRRTPVAEDHRELLCDIAMLDREPLPVNQVLAVVEAEHVRSVSSSSRELTTTSFITSTAPGRPHVGQGGISSGLGLPAIIMTVVA
jgi:hypothetical protein